MASSKSAWPLQGPISMSRIPARTPGPLGYLDQADPNSSALLGDTPGPLGLNDWADPNMSHSFLDGYLGSAERFSPQAPTNELSWEDIKSDFEQWESVVTHLYRDPQGYITIGIGNMLPNSATAKALAFCKRAGGTPASGNDIEVEYKAVKNLDYGQKYAAGWYKSRTKLDLSEDDCWKLFKKRIYDEFLPALEADFSGWESFPSPVKRALLDMVYNLGRKGLQKFGRLKHAVDSKDWKKAADVCKRGGIPDERNDWTRDLFLLAAGEKK